MREVLGRARLAKARPVVAGLCDLDPDRPVELADKLVAAAVILWTIYRERRVSPDNIYGTICGYLLIGVAFGHVYSLIEQVAPGSFHASGDLAADIRNPDRSHFVFTYFGVLSLAGVGAGFGDVTPGTGLARGCRRSRQSSGCSTSPSCSASGSPSYIRNRLNAGRLPRHQPGGRSCRHGVHGGHDEPRQPVGPTEASPTGRLLGSLAGLTAAVRCEEVGKIMRITSAGEVGPTEDSICPSETKRPEFDAVMATTRRERCGAHAHRP